MQKFAEHEAIVSEAIDDLYGETVLVEPRADGKFVRTERDDQRHPFEILGAIVDFQPTLARLRNAGRNDADMAEVSADLCHISVADAKLKEALRRGDRIRLPDRPGSPVVQIAKDPEPDGIGRTIFRCVAVSTEGGAL